MQQSAAQKIYLNNAMTSVLKSLIISERESGFLDLIKIVFKTPSNSILRWRIQAHSLTWFSSEAIHQTMDTFPFRWTLSFCHLLISLFERLLVSHRIYLLVWMLFVSLWLQLYFQHSVQLTPWLAPEVWSNFCKRKRIFIVWNGHGKVKFHERNRNPLLV